jgi:hypothetical protein
MLSSYEFDVGIDNTDLMCEPDVRLAVSFSKVSEIRVNGHNARNDIRRKDRFPGRKRQSRALLVTPGFIG